MLFRSLPVADAVFRIDRLPAALVDQPRDAVTLGWDERSRVRARRRTDAGLEFGLSLPRGTLLREGDCLPLDNPPLVIVVHERLEPVLLAQPASAADWALWAYHIGNSHQPLMVAADGLVCLDDPGMVQVLDYHHIPYSRAQRPFTPVTASPGHDAER